MGCELYEDAFLVHKGRVYRIVKIDKEKTGFGTYEIKIKVKEVGEDPGY